MIVITLSLEPLHVAIVVYRLYIHLSIRHIVMNVTLRFVFKVQMYLPVYVMSDIVFVFCSGKD